MDDKSLEILEFPQIREILAGFTSFSASRELVANLQPMSDYEQITLLLKQSAEARRLLSLEPDFSIGGVYDVRQAVGMAALDMVLEPQSLLEVQQTLIAFRELRSRLGDLSRDFPLLWSIAEGIVEFPQIEKDIAGCLGPSGEVLDAASPSLANIRQQLREVRGQLLERLEAIIGSPRWRKILQETFITERDGRYVIPVKIECRHEVKGIVHDISNTGATVFIEPATTVGMGNALRELVIAEKREIERILGNLSVKVGACSAEISWSIAFVAELDMALAKARYARKVKAVEPAITVFSKDKKEADSQQAGLLRFVEARHPLLQEKAVPFSAEIGRDFSILLITGPNTGGKTVTLKAIGLLSIMAQAGIPIPVSPKSSIPVFDGIFADIGDEQSIEQTLSTFSWHMGNIVRIINSATEKSLVLLDELGTSTDPAEGSALARAILRFFLSRGTLTVATTHYTDLKAFAYTTAGMQNASLEFDPVTLTPTYHLAVGIPGGSNALATASRLGLPREVVADASGMISEGSQELESLLTSLMAEKQKIETLGSELTGERGKLEQRNAELENERQRLKAEERMIVQEVRDRVVREAAELHKQIRQAVADLRREKSNERVQQARKAIAAVREQLNSEIWQSKVGVGTDETKAEEDRINIGDTVRLKEVGLPATVLSISEKAQQVEVQAGRTKIRLGLDSVEKITLQPDKAVPEFTVVKRQTGKRAVPLEFDLRGKRADEVEPELDHYLNDASLANLNEARIIHGIGTGTVRSIVRDFVASHPLVKSFRPGGQTEGGDGVTIIRL
ncbi:endonuclease MutS2 [Candidatus Omnitrophota bacterium]